MVTRGTHEPLTLVQQMAIFSETADKELRYLRLATQFGINPYTKTVVVSDKVNALPYCSELKEDEEFLKLHRYTNSPPTEKYTRPLTSNQEYGWDSKPLVEKDLNDQRLNFHAKRSNMTKFVDAMWQLKDQMNRKN